MAYSIHFTSAALRMFERLDRPDQERVTRAIDGLALNPRPPGVKKLAGMENLWRIRTGDYRILYRIVDRTLIVIDVTIGHRSDAYR